MQLEVIYDSQATNRKQGRLPPPSALLLVAWNISPLAGWNTQKHHHKQVDVLTFWLKNRLITFFDKKNFNRYNSNTFCEEYIKVKKHFYFRRFWVVSFQSFGSHIRSQTSRLGLRRTNYLKYTAKKPCWNAPNSDVDISDGEPKDVGVGIFRPPPPRLVCATLSTSEFRAAFFTV